MSRNLAPALATMSVLVGAYLCAYYGSVKGGDDEYVGPVEEATWNAAGEPGFRIYDEYRIGGAAAKVFFWPANQLDRIARREHWFDPLDDGSTCTVGLE